MDGVGNIPIAGDDWAFFLDVDGTLIDIAPTPDAARAAPETVALLEGLSRRFKGAVALISGRPIADLDRIFAPLKLAAAGLHGMMRRDADGKVSEAKVRLSDIEHARAQLAGIERRFPGVLIEDKGKTIAVHYRQAPHHAADILSILNAIVDAVPGPLEVLPGKMLAELRPPGPHKGSAILDFMGDAPFAGRRPVFIGDDVTDEDGFRAVNAMDGVSIRIGAGAASRAAHVLDGVADLRDFLNAIVTRHADARS